MSRGFLIASILLLLGTHLYYPKWMESKTEATLSWDVSGYYFYLPATFIYKDISDLKWKDSILEKYNPTPDLQQAFLHESSGNYVMKYSVGQSIILSPGFFAGHIWAKFSKKYPPDGFSFPYQFMISMWVLLISVIGLIVLRICLLEYFDELPTGLSLLGMVIGSNYLNYAAIDGAMTHNTLFTVYTLIIYSTILFYQKPSYTKAFLIGLLCGLAALTRPTEVISVLIPVLWGVRFNVEGLRSRFNFILKEYKSILLAIMVFGLVGLIQPLYWHSVTGEWIVYSYQDQGFSWLKPHIIDGMFSYKSGWLTYSPFMVFSLVGFYHLAKQKKGLFAACLIFCVLFIYIAFAWDIWWYGGALGQRAMVQSYAIFCFPLAAFFSSFLNWSKVAQIIGGLFIALFIYANLWFTHQVHHGGIVYVGQMRKAYFWKTLFTYEKNQENLKLLDDVNEIYEGELQDVQQIFIDTSTVIRLDLEKQNSPVIEVQRPLNDDFEWYRVSAEFYIEQKEWFYWTMTQFIVQTFEDNTLVGNYMFRIQRHVNDNTTKELYLDFRKPDTDYSTLRISFWNAGGNKPVTISNIKVIGFNEP